MAPSFDYADSSLICGEDNSAFDDNDYYGGVEKEIEEESFYRRINRNHDQNAFFSEGIPLQSEECLGLMIEKESHHLPCADYLLRLRTGDLDFGARKEAVDWIAKVHAHFGFGPLSAYLSVNYLDRFLSAYELPKGKAWMMQLLTVACLSLAAKMEETNVPLSLDLQVCDTKFVFEARTIKRMELLVLSTLKWRMQAITPFSFIDYFLHKINDDDDKLLLRTALFRSIELILSTTKGIDMLEFKPSEVAAAVAISVARDTHTMDIDKAISNLTRHIQKERVLKCIEMMHDLSLIDAGCLDKINNKNKGVVVGDSDGNGNGNGVVGAIASEVVFSSSIPQSPIGVLEAAAVCLSYKSNDTTVGSCANSSHHNNLTPDPKRRKLNNRPCQVEI